MNITGWKNHRLKDVVVFPQEILIAELAVACSFCLHLIGSKESACWVRKTLWRREWLPTPVFSPGEFHGHRSLAGYSPWDRKESDMTE